MTVKFALKMFLGLTKLCSLFQYPPTRKFLISETCFQEMALNFLNGPLLTRGKSFFFLSFKPLLVSNNIFYRSIDKCSPSSCRMYSIAAFRARLYVLYFLFCLRMSFLPCAKYRNLGRASIGLG